MLGSTSQLCSVSKGLCPQLQSFCLRTLFFSDVSHCRIMSLETSFVGTILFGSFPCNSLPNISWSGVCFVHGWVSTIVANFVALLNFLLIGFLFKSRDSGALFQPQHKMIYVSIGPGRTFQWRNPCFCATFENFEPLNGGPLSDFISSGIPYVWKVEWHCPLKLTW